MFSRRLLPVAALKQATRFTNKRMMAGTTGDATLSIPSLLTGEAAVELRNNSNVKFLDGSWHLNKARIALDEFNAERIPGAQHINVDAVSDQLSKLPHMVPSAEFFAEYVEKLGVSSENHVVIYSTHEAFSMPRIWWMFRLFGHKNVSILDGGLPAWKRAGGDVETGAPIVPTRGQFEAKLDPKLVVGWEDVLKIVQTGSAQMVDARSAARFKGEVAEPRAGLPSGHIPGSLSLPFTSIVKPDDVTTFRSKKEIRDAFVDAGVIFGAKTVLTCGSGVSAAVLGFGLHLMGKPLESFPIYDGSWTEWAQRGDLPRMPAEVKK